MANFQENQVGRGQHREPIKVFATIDAFPMEDQTILRLAERDFGNLLTMLNFPPIEAGLPGLSQQESTIVARYAMGVFVAHYPEVASNEALGNRLRTLFQENDPVLFAQEGLSRIEDVQKEKLRNIAGVLCTGFYAIRNDEPKNPKAEVIDPVLEEYTRIVEDYLLEDDLNRKYPRKNTMTETDFKKGNQPPSPAGSEFSLTALLKNATEQAQRFPRLTLQRSILATTVAAVALYVGANLWNAGMNSATRESVKRSSPEKNSPKKKVLMPDGNMLSTDLIATADSLLREPGLDMRDTSILKMLTQRGYVIGDISQLFPQKMKAGDEGLIVRRYPIADEAFTPLFDSLERIDSGKEFTRIAEIKSYNPTTGLTDIFWLLDAPTYYESIPIGNTQQIPDAPNIAYSLDGTTVQQVMTRWVRGGQIDQVGILHPFASPVVEQHK